MVEADPDPVIVTEVEPNTEGVSVQVTENEIDEVSEPLVETVAENVEVIV